jgi:hypothetical protein
MYKGIATQKNLGKCALIWDMSQFKKFGTITEPCSNPFEGNFRDWVDMYIINIMNIPIGVPS